MNKVEEATVHLCSWKG